LDHPDYAVEKVTFEMAGLRLEPGKFRTEPLPIDFARRAAAIVEAVGKLCHTIKPSFVFASRDTPEESGDSGEEAPRDDLVTSPFTDEETVYINIVLQDCWARFTHAQHKLFQNAVGKFFLESFLKLCTCVLNCHLQVLVSTNPNGQYQPGFTEVGWTVPAKVTRKLSAKSTQEQKSSGFERRLLLCPERIRE
jgi:hypothetical protein